MEVPFEVGAIHPVAGDVIVLRHPALLSQAARERVQMFAREAFAPARAVVLDGGMDITRVSMVTVDDIAEVMAKACTCPHPPTVDCKTWALNKVNAVLEAQRMARELKERGG